MKAYCIKCKKMVEMKNPKEVKMKSGNKGLQGICPTCGIKIFRIGG